MKSFFVLYGILQFCWLFHFSQSAYLEDKTLYITNVQNGPLRIGDLWDCTTSQSRIFNLYSKNISDYLTATPTHSRRYVMSHVTDLKATLKDNFHGISDEFKLDILAGIIRHDRGYLGRGYNFLVEKFHINYNEETFNVRALRSAPIDEYTKESILKGEIKATHVVNEVTLGGEVLGLVEFMPNNVQSKIEFDKFLGKLELGQVTAFLKSQLDVFDKKFGLYKQISHLRPFIMYKSPIPKNMTELFDTIESITSDISQAKYFPKLNKEGKIITGIPIKYTLVPLSHILADFKIEKKYQKMNHEMLENFINIFDSLGKWESNGFIKKQISDQNPHLISIISDRKNDFTKLIEANEAQLLSRAEEIGQISKHFLSGYKDGWISDRDMDYFYNNKFLVQFNSTLIQENVSELLAFGNNLSTMAKLSEIEQGSFIKIISSQWRLDVWWSRSVNNEMKILLLTNGSAPKSAFNLYKLAPSLSDRGIELGVAVPNICQNFSIIIKNVREKTFHFENSEIITILKVFSTLLDNANYDTAIIDRHFVQIASSLYWIPSLENYPLSNFMDIYSALKIYSDVEFVDNHFELENFILDKNEGRFLFFLSMNSYFSVYESFNLVRKFKNKFPKGQWVAAKMELSVKNDNDSPILFIFKNGEFLASILDKLDLAYVIDHINMDKLADIKSVYNFTANEATLGKNFIHPHKLNFVYQLLNTFGHHHFGPKHNSNIEYFDKIENLLNLLVAANSPLKFEFLENFLNLVRVKHPSIYTNASENLKICNQIGYPVISNENIQDWRQFSQNLKLKNSNSESVLVKMLAQTINSYLRTNEKDFKGQILQNYLETIPENEIVDKKVVQNAIAQKDFWKAIQLLAPQRFTKANSLKFLLEINKVRNFQDQKLRLEFYQKIFQLDLNSEEIDEICNDPIISYYSTNDGNQVTKEKFKKQSPMPPAKDNFITPDLE